MNEKKNKNYHMNKMLNILMIIIFISMGVVIYFMLKKESPSEIPPKLVLNDTVAFLYIGDEYSINYSFENNNHNIALKWDVSDKNVISLYDNKVKALSKGMSYVIASYKYNDEEIINKMMIFVREYDDEAPIIKVNGNPDESVWSNTDVNLSLNITDKSDYKLSYYIENGDNKSDEIDVSNNNILISNNGINIVYIKAVDEYNNKSEVSVKINIDKEKPTCSLKLNSNGVIEVSKNDNIGLSYYGTSNNYNGNNTDTLKTAIGKSNYYVKDLAGNTNTCEITIEKKLLYRKSTCLQCASCKNAGCGSYSNWINTGSHCNNKSSASDYIGEYEKYTNCHYDTSCSSSKDTGAKERKDKFYRCTRSIRSCNQYKASCDICGCSSWSAYGEWTDTIIKEDKNTKVQKEERLYQK